MSYFLYIMHSKKLKKYVTGVSAHPEKRIKYHNMGLKDWSVDGKPWELVYTKEYEQKPDADIIEKDLREKSYEEIRGFIAQNS